MQVEDWPGADKGADRKVPAEAAPASGLSAWPVDKSLTESWRTADSIPVVRLHMSRTSIR